MVLIMLSMGVAYSTRSFQVYNEETVHPYATLTFQDGSRVVIELYPEYAPNTVNNFIFLAEQSFYNQTYINQLLPDLLIQLGDPIGNGYGYPGYFIESECTFNGYLNKLSHTKGTVSMARGTSFNTEGSQFFIVLEDHPDLNGQYAAFGKVIEGLDFLIQLSNQDLASAKSEYILTSLTVDTLGFTFEEPTIFTAKE
jgi:peptidyl-prolyl cis-trans isomerase B (cyclophilin B)